MLIERYVYAVTRYLPKENRQEIEREICSLIEDMLEEKGDIEAVLEILGDPEKFAENYQERKTYLIGPALFNQYLFVLKIVLFSVFLGLTVATTSGFVFGESKGVLDTILQYFGTIINGTIQGAAWVTIIFAIMERSGKGWKQLKDEKWTIAQLPEIPNQKAEIKKGESIFNIIFSTIFFLLFYYFQKYMAIYIPSEGKTEVIPFFNQDNLTLVTWFILGLFLVGLGREILKVIYGKWTFQLAVSYSILTGISTVLFVFFLKSPLIINEIFSKRLMEILQENKVTVGNFDLFNNGLLAVIVVISIIEIGMAFYRSTRK